MSLERVLAVLGLLAFGAVCAAMGWALAWTDSFRRYCGWTIDETDEAGA